MKTSHLKGSFWRVSTWHGVLGMSSSLEVKVFYLDLMEVKG